MIRFDFGPSFHKPSRTVREWILLRLPVSLELDAYGPLFALAVGLGAGCAAFNRDYTMINGAVLVYAVLVMGLNLVSDIMLGWLDPRIRAR